MKITIDDDFDLYKIAYSGQCFRVRRLDENTFFFITGDHSVEISHDSHDSHGDGSFSHDGHGDGSPDSPAPTVLDVSCTAKEWESIWHDYFDLDTNYRQIRGKIPATDTFLKNASELGKGIRILRQDKFEMLISFIISQRKSIPAIKTSVEKISERYGKRLNTSDDKIMKVTDCYRFPAPKELLGASQQDLADCGLGYRISYITEAVKRVAKGEIELEKLDVLSDEELIDTLKSFYGVGDKVANCIALFAYHRTGLAPVDTWIKKIIESEYNGINPFCEYGDYAGIMQQYMFYAAQHIKIL